MFSVEKKNALTYLQAPQLLECDFLVHAFCTRVGGASRDEYKSLNMSFREGDEEFRVLANWNKLSTTFGIPLENFLVLNQVHGDSIFVIKPHGEFFTSRDQLNYDAIITNRPNLAVCIKTADCVPVFIADRVKKVIAVVHAGWKGSALAITEKVVRTMKNQFACQLQDMVAAIGPSIGSCCYEVDKAAVDAFDGLRNRELFLRPSPRSGHWMLNLVEANRLQLQNEGFNEQNIETSGLCTMCRQDAFFSHRGSGGITGRQVNFMMIKGETPCRAIFVDEDLKSIH